MAIQDILNKLLSEPLMKNMRQYIVDGIEQVYADATAKGGPNSGPSGPFMSIAALYSHDFPSGKEGTWLVFDSSFTDGAHSFMWNSTNATWKDLGVYQATGLSNESVYTKHLVKGVVTPITTNFIKPFGNLVLAGEVRVGGYFQPNGSWLANALYNTVVIPVIPTKKYITNVVQSLNLAFFNRDMSYKTYIAAGAWDKKITTPTDVFFVGLTYRTSQNNIGELMLVEGDVLPAQYIPYGFELDETIVLSKENYDLYSDVLKTKDKTMLIIGDSISETKPTAADDPETATSIRSNWPLFTAPRLQLGKVWNFSRSGASFKDQNNLADNRRSIFKQITIARDQGIQPDMVVVSAGANDGANSLGSYETAMSKAALSELDRSNLYEALRWNFWAIRTYFPDAVCFTALPIQRASNEQPPELLEAITKMAKRYNFIIINAHDESGIVREFEVQSGVGRDLSDGLHPLVSGQKKMDNVYSCVILNSFNY